MTTVRAPHLAVHLYAPNHPTLTSSPRAIGLAARRGLRITSHAPLSAVTHPWSYRQGTSLVAADWNNGRELRSPTDQLTAMGKLKMNLTTRRAQNTKLIQGASGLLERDDATVQQIESIYDRLKNNNDS
ncbi:hypothetical protein HPB52_007045 [Rhipicephalus sanguineus]|uniref:Uncharacterized protein n=1 Tax=Rhipicephalus sanguineus TaxID=34632 RepID=A0A9D4Q7M0_RHISA|nr:hypothetical protein HPB52_007045 [Rhipicephalus sanguineus]